ncbi:MAG: D-alanyl-D-alanine carboxypeptidase [Firmicutes bacterium]|nr:D-alanyl-D-alanine carboxypeptidase [Bacillota bacterium]
MGKVKSKRRQKMTKIALAVIAVLMVATFVAGTAMTSRGYAARMATGRPGAVGAAIHAQTSARAMCTIEVSSGRILYEKNAYAKLPMASTTKVVTAITVLENVKSIDEVVNIHPKAIGVEGTSIYLQKGEQLTVRELLLGMMLRSGNDASNALALHISKSLDEFSELMNQTALKAGAKNSSFRNPHGLDQDGHYTTAHDLALISAYAMKNPTFAEIVATKDTRISGKDYPRMLQNKNRLLRSNKNVIGIKTGFTSKAGRCFVGALERNDMQVVCVVLNCGPMFEESETLMQRGTNEFFMHKVLAAETLITPTHPDRFDRVGMVAEDHFYPLTEAEIKRLEIQLNDHDACVFLDDKLLIAVPLIPMEE